MPQGFDYNGGQFSTDITNFLNRLALFVALIGLVMTTGLLDSSLVSSVKRKSRIMDLKLADPLDLSKTKNAGIYLKKAQSKSSEFTRFN